MGRRLAPRSGTKSKGLAREVSALQMDADLQVPGLAGEPEARHQITFRVELIAAGLGVGVRGQGPVQLPHPAVGARAQAHRLGPQGDLGTVIVTGVVVDLEVHGDASQGRQVGP